MIASVAINLKNTKIFTLSKTRNTIVLFLGAFAFDFVFVPTPETDSGGNVQKKNQCTRFSPQNQDGDEKKKEKDQAVKTA